MGQRLMDYMLVAFVILIVLGLFRLSRIIMREFLKKLKNVFGILTPDRILLTAFYFLLIGLLLLPALTSLLSLINNNHLTGGVVLHLVLVAVSIVIFSIAEDLFRDFSVAETSDKWSISTHFKYLSLPLLAFWAFGCVFLSPLFYSGFTIILVIFYLYALSCRPSVDSGNKTS